MLPRTGGDDMAPGTRVRTQVTRPDFVGGEETDDLLKQLG